MLIFYFLNTAALFFVEYQNVDFALEYTSLQSRSVDIYLSFFMYSSLMIFILSKIKREFMKQKERAVRSDKLKSAFLANMSHEIRTPMNGIIGFSELLVKEKDEDKQQQYLEIIQNSGTSLLRLVNEILDLSKIEAGDVEVNNSSFSIKDVLNEIKDLYLIELIKKERVHVKLNYYLPDGDFVIYSDKYRVKQTLSNLLSNAIKFTVQGSIVISCRKKEQELVFSVSDTGTGIPEEDQPKIYDRFTKFDYDGLNTEGSGIGLSIVKKTTEILKGRIWLKSETGLGSTFFVAIPFVSKGDASSEEENNTSSSEMPDSKKTILLVEDDKTSFLLIKEILRPMEFNIHHVTDGNDAVEFIKKNPYTNLKLMDIKLPFMDGYKATTAIKKMNSKITIIAQTAYAMLGDREKAISAGCDDYLTKPIDPNKLLELIKAHIK